MRVCVCVIACALSTHFICIEVNFTEYTTISVVMKVVAMSQVNMIISLSVLKSDNMEGYCYLSEGV